MNFKVIIIFLLIIININKLNASVFYEKSLNNVIPFHLKINGTCEKLKYIQPIYKEIKNHIVYGKRDNFLITCNIKNRITRINLYNKKFFKLLKIEKNSTYKKFKEYINKQYRKEYIKYNKNKNFNIAEIFVNKNIYQIYIYDNKKHSFYLTSIFNMKNYPSYKYIKNIKNKKNIGLLISWLINY